MKRLMWNDEETNGIRERLESAQREKRIAVYAERADRNCDVFSGEPNPTDEEDEE